MADERKDLDAFEAAIKEHLDGRAAADPAFAQKYASEKKSLKDCCKYIYTTVQKSIRIAWCDDEIFGLAVHYYDEENPGEIRDVKPSAVKRGKPHFTDEEMAQMREEAKREFRQKEMQILEEAAKAARKRKAEAARRRVEAENAEMGSLFG